MNEELFVKWIDGQLTDDERAIVDAAVKDDPSLLQEMESIRGVGIQLKEHFPASEEPPYPEFFNTQLMRRIAEEEKAPARPAKKSPWWEKLSWGWIPASGLAMALAFFAGTKLQKSAAEEVRAVASLPSVYTSQDSHEAEVIANESGEVSLIVMKGLDAIGDDVDFFSVSTSAVVPQRYLLAQERDSKL